MKVSCRHPLYPTSKLHTPCHRAPSSTTSQRTNSHAATPPSHSSSICSNAASLSWSLTASSVTSLLCTQYPSHTYCNMHRSTPPSWTFHRPRCSLVWTAHMGGTFTKPLLHLLPGCTTTRKCMRNGKDTILVNTAWISYQAAFSALAQAVGNPSMQRLNLHMPQQTTSPFPNMPCPMQASMPTWQPPWPMPVTR
jgi:hypothetical protein